LEGPDAAFNECSAQVEAELAAVKFDGSNVEEAIADRVPLQAEQPAMEATEEDLQVLRNRTARDLQRGNVDEIRDFMPGLPVRCAAELHAVREALTSVLACLET